MLCHAANLFNARGVYVSAALLAVLDCLPGDATIHLYGFNWSSRNWAGHLMTLERSFIQAFSPQLAGRLLVHPTPCNSYRECEEV